MATKKKEPSWLDFPGVPTVVMSLGVFAVAAVVAWPVMVFHGSARWIGETIWVAVWVVPIAMLAIVALLKPERRAQRRLEKLRNERLRAEGRHPDQLRQRQMQAHWQEQQQKQAQKEVAQLAARERAKQQTEQRRQELRGAIEHEERLREERLSKGRRLT